MAGKIGVLALQGAFAKHEQMLEKLGISSLKVRHPKELFECRALIIPGGESTAMTCQIHEMNFLEPLKEFAKTRPLFGTCAGMILMAKKGVLSLLDITVTRNAYGGQRHSFHAPLDLPFSQAPLQALFIRAPCITAIHSEAVQILAEQGGTPVLIQQGFHLAASFHPELTDDPSIHQYFLGLGR